jgi:hypothetical protein
MPAAVDIEREDLTTVEDGEVNKFPQYQADRFRTTHFTIARLKGPLVISHQRGQLTLRHC